MDTITYRIHNLYEVFAQLREVIIDVTSVEVAYMFLILVLLFGCITFEPCLKLLAAISWETTMFVNSHHTVEHSFDRLQSQGGVDNRATIFAIVPTKSVFANILSRRIGPCVLYLMREA